MGRRSRLEIGGMTCRGCEEHVAAALTAAGATQVAVDWQASRAVLDLPGGVAEDDLRARVAAAGYQAGELEMVAGPAGHPGRGAPPTEGPVDYDLVVVGAGSAAFAAAIRATEAGQSVALVEEDTIGGTCVIVGCVPSKTLLAAGKRRAQASANPFEGLGVSADRVGPGGPCRPVPGRTASWRLRASGGSNG